VCREGLFPLSLPLSVLLVALVTYNFDH